MIFQLLSLYTESNAQNLSVTGSLGVSNFLGDLATTYIPPFGADFSLGATYDLASNWRLRLNFSNLNIQGDDASSKANGVAWRGLNFKSNVSELALLGEYDLLDVENYDFIPYLFAGVAAYHFNPRPLNPISGKISFNGFSTTISGDVDLHSLGTEGQYLTGIPGVKGNYSGRSYDLTQLNIQLGAGVRFDISDGISLGFEANLRKLFTDYLDDVSGPHYVTPSDWKAAEDYYHSLGSAGKSQLDNTLKAQAYAYRGILGSKFIDVNANSFPRGNANNNDAFYSFQLRLSFRLNDIGGPDTELFTPGRSGGRRQLSSPNVY